MAIYGLNATEPLFSRDGTTKADCEFFDIASSLRMLNCSLVLIGAYCREASSSALVMVLPLN